MMGNTNRIVVVLGPTAGGKSELAVGVALHFGGEVISADSMQVYKHLNAGTAKPSRELLAAVRHHLIDAVEPTERFTVADWLSRAEGIIADLQGRGKLPVVVGGTNLYIKALLEGMFEGPPADEAFRAALDAVTVHELHARLEKVDPAAASRIDRNDRKRITRALEVFHTTGNPISSLQTQWEGAIRYPLAAGGSPRGLPAAAEAYRHNPVLLGLRWSTEAINPRINARVKKMFHPDDGTEGLIAETRRLLDAGLLGPQAREAIGTKQVLAHFAGEYSAEEALEQVKIETRRFAKSQRTWLKRYRGVHWLEAEQKQPDELLKEAVIAIQAEL